MSRKRKAAKKGSSMTRAHFRALKVMAGGHCVYCRAPGPLTRDHITPISKGGKHHWTNIAPACGDCNQAKADDDWKEFMVREGLEERIPEVEAFMEQAEGLPENLGEN